MIKKWLCIFGLVLVLPNMALAQNAQSVQNAESKNSDKLGQHPEAKHGKPSAQKLDDTRYEFVRANIIFIFYHELAHALIDMLDLAVLGQEEDAADVFGVLMVERLFSDQQALQINTGAAKGFWVDEQIRVRSGDDLDWADEHGPDMQRYYNLVCLTYGAAPKLREEFAVQMGLSPDRMEICEGEYEMAMRSWGPIIQGIEQVKSGNPVSLRRSTRTQLQVRAADLIADQVGMVNGAYKLPENLRVSVKRCERGSDFYAYYSSDRKKITICTNYIDELYRDAPK